ncbi:hypothetical protein OH77DRAFT_1423429 [Trametes cingulata]|nr:hypothetical protein OH77DRAFT_1423429 [Trametes cingulata]
MSDLSVYLATSESYSEAPHQSLLNDDKTRSTPRKLSIYSWQFDNAESVMNGRWQFWRQGQSHLRGLDNLHTNQI